MLTDDIENYRESVRLALSGDEDGIVLNGSLKHAQIVIEEAFKVASSKVRVLSHGLDGSCYDNSDVLRAIKEFLSRDFSQLDILVEQPLNEVRDGLLLKSLTAEIESGKVTISYVPPKFSDGYTFNFLVVDDRSCRFENDRKKPEAVVVGGEKWRKTTLHLTDLFDRLKKSVLESDDEVNLATA